MKYTAKTETYFDPYAAPGAVLTPKHEGLPEEFSPDAPFLAAIIRKRRETGAADTRFTELTHEVSHRPKQQNRKSTLNGRS